MSNDLETWIFGYSADGLRVSRTKDVVLEVGSTTRFDTTKHNYFYVDGLLTQDTIVFTSKTYTDYVPITPAAYAATPAAVTETTYQQTLHFSYDAGGRPLSLRYTDRDGVVSEYFYVLNLQGDVIALLNSSGVLVVVYTYDAWGKVLSIEGSQANTIGQLNPLRYRGYYYDNETGLYYLQSRYYDPEWGRFLNADSYVSTGQGLLGNNMFAYCLNNPVNMYDPGGTACATFLGDNHVFSDRMLTRDGGGGGADNIFIPTSKQASEDIIQHEMECMEGVYAPYIDAAEDTYAVYEFGSGVWEVVEGIAIAVLPDPTFVSDLKSVVKIGNGLRKITSAIIKWID